MGEAHVQGSVASFQPAVNTFQVVKETDHCCITSTVKVKTCRNYKVSPHTCSIGPCSEGIEATGAVITPTGTYKLLERFDLLCIGLLQESTPELTFIRRAEVDQPVVHSGQQVIDPHLLPLAVHPELHKEGVNYSLLMHERLYLGIYSEGEAAFVAVLEALLQRHHLLEQSGVDRQGRDCREQPAVV